MRITNIQNLKYTQSPQNRKEYKTNPNNSNNTVKNYTGNVFAYRDFNISFGARTPENFYSQDFNRENMPYTMKNYLNYDYEQRQHMPPEQMMNEVFKYLDTVKTFDDVKTLYPNENLFNNLHENNKNVRTGILSEIKIAKDLSDTPLLKDGSDNFGMYLLKKIYMEGKTLKEISKDFLEKDINDEYKGFITKPIDYATTSAYGIKFPNNNFWHSFIATRDDYKAFFVTLPKNTVDPNRAEANTNGSKNFSTGNRNSVEKGTESEPTSRVRKYRLPKYKKDQLTNDIKNSKGDIQSVETKVRKRFTKNDPEASFIVKYLSPIMTIAADKVHLSEEERLFSETEKTKGKTIKGQFMFERFWKANPELLEHFATAITDTMEMFEEIYAAGGLIPINNQYEAITSETANQKAIDYVTPEFIELLDYTKSIAPKREEGYARHDMLQKQWEEHFNERYGNPDTAAENIDDLEEELKGVKELHPEFSKELLENTAKNFNSEIFELNGKNGENIIVTGNLNEVFKDNLKMESEIFPTRYASQYIREMLANPEITDKYKLSLATRQIKDMIDDRRIMSDDEFEDTYLTILYTYYMKNSNNEMAASAAMADTINKYLEGKAPTKMYKLYTHEYTQMIKDSELKNVVSDILNSNKKELNERYEQYSKPLTNAEKNKIEIALLEQLSKYDGKDSIVNSDIKEIIIMLKEILETAKYKKKFLREAIGCSLPFYRFSKSILDKNLDSEHKKAKFEQIMNLIIKDLLNYDVYKSSVLINILNKETIDKHKSKISDELFNKFQLMANDLEPNERSIYEFSNDRLKDLDKLYTKKL